MKLNDLRELRAAKIAEMRSLNAKAMDANRDLDDSERTRFEALDGEVTALNGRIERAEKVAALERVETASEAINGEMSRELRSYSVAKAVRESMGDRLTGLEAEMHAELSKGKEVRGVMVPVDLLLGSEQRAVTTTTPSAFAGGNLVQTTLAAMTDHRRPALMVERLGATVLRGLVGDLDLPRLKESGTAYWVAEHTDTTGSDPKFIKRTMSPKTVSAEYELSRRMQLQTAGVVETILRADLAKILATAVDRAAICGGGSNEPTGIMQDVDVTMQPNALLSIESTADMLGILEGNDVDGSLAFLMHSDTMRYARQRKDDEGHAVTIAETFHNTRTEVSNNVAETAESPSSRALILGEWAGLYLGFWSGVDLLANPYASTVASKGGMLLHAFLDCDVVIRAPESFVFRGISGWI